jgi:CheY-like chemotaxis protein
MFPLVISPTASSDPLPFAPSTPAGNATRPRQSRNLPRSVASAHTGGPRILLVDDDPVLLNLSETVLVAEGYQVQSCSNAEDALLSYRRHPDIDLLLTDIQMPPGMSGLELAEMLTHQRPALPVVVLSGAIIREDQRKMMLQRGWSFIDKPLSVPRLLSVISIMLRRRPARSSDASIPLRKVG